MDIRNRIILALRPAAQEFIGQRLTTRAVAAGEVILEEGAPLTHAIFPHEGVMALMASMENGRSVEKVSIGLEGFIGLTVLMGGTSSVSRTVVNVPGYASWLKLSDMDEAMDEFVCVRQTMLRYAQALIIQAMESVACNSLHSADQRVSRWLLHAHDRVVDDRFLVTQQAIAEMLGLRRSTVSSVCSSLQGAGIIDYSRGAVSVTDRAALEHHACECYGRIHRASLLA